MRGLRDEMSFQNKHKNAGFTIVEMIASIVIASVLAVGVVQYIGDAVEGVDSTANRNQLASSGRAAISRLAMELHNALPNSIRVRYVSANDQCIEFIPVIGSASYINPPFTGAGDNTFDVVQFDPDLNGTSEGYAVIYPSNIAELYDGNNGASSLWPNFPTRGPIEKITSIAAGGTNISTITLTKNHRYSRRSPNERLYLVADPVSYCVKTDKLYRYTNYGFYDVQSSTEEQSGVCQVALNQTCLPNYTTAPDKMLITNNIDNASAAITAFNVTAQALNRNALISIDLNFASDGDVVRLNHEVLSRNVP